MEVALIGLAELKAAEKRLSEKVRGLEPNAENFAGMTEPCLLNGDECNEYVSGLVRDILHPLDGVLFGGAGTVGIAVSAMVAAISAYQERLSEHAGRIHLDRGTVEVPLGLVLSGYTEELCGICHRPRSVCEAEAAARDRAADAGSDS